MYQVDCDILSCEVMISFLENVVFNFDQKRNHQVTYMQKIQ